MKKPCVCVHRSPYPASDRCKHVGQPQNPSPPSTTIFFAAAPDMRRPDPPAAAAEAVAPAAAATADDRCLTTVLGVLETPLPEIAAGFPVKGEDTGTKPSALTRSVSVQSTARAVLAMVAFTMQTSDESKSNVCNSIRRGGGGTAGCVLYDTPLFFAGSSPPQGRAASAVLLLCRLSRHQLQRGEECDSLNKGAWKGEYRVAEKMTIAAAETRPKKRYRCSARLLFSKR